MKIMLLTSRVVEGGDSQKFGDIIDLPNDEAMRLVRRGSAKRIEDNEVETAMIGTPSREGKANRSMKRVQV